MTRKAATVLAVGASLWMPGWAFAQLAAERRCAELANVLQVRENLVSGWGREATVLLAMSILIIVFGSATALSQSHKFAKQFAIALGLLIAVLGGIKSAAFKHDHHAYDRAVLEARPHVESGRISLLACKEIPDGSWRAFVAEIQREVGAIDAIGLRLVSGEDVPPPITTDVWQPISLLVSPAWALGNSGPASWVAKPPNSNEHLFWAVGVGHGSTLQEARAAAVRDSEEQVEAAIFGALSARTISLEEQERLRDTWRGALVEEKTSFIPVGEGAFDYFRLVRVSRKALQGGLEFYAIASQRQVKEPIAQVFEVKAMAASRPAMERIDRSEELLARTREGLSDDLWNQFSEGRYARLRGDFAAAVRELSVVVDKAPNVYLAWFNLALANDRQGNAAEAEAAYRKALELEQSQELKDSSIYNTLGYFLYRQGKVSEAQPLLEAAVRLDPSHAKAKRNLEAARLAVGGASAASER